jgi:hypothetical protein
MVRSDQQSSPGWYGEVTGNVNSVFSIVGEVGGMYESIGGSAQSGPISVSFSGKVRAHTFMGGARVRAWQSRVLVPYAQVLFGAARISAKATTTVSGLADSFFLIGDGTPITTSTSQTEPVVQAGGGVTLRLSRGAGCGVRVTVDRRWVFLEDETGGTTRISAGAVLRF